MFGEAPHRVVSVEELEADMHFPNLLNDIDFVMMYGLRDR